MHTRRLQLVQKLIATAAVTWGAALVAAVALPALAGEAYYSFEGQFLNGAATQSFLFDVESTLRRPDPFSLRTWQYTGGANAAGDSILGLGFNPILRLYGGETPVGVDDDINRTSSNLDAELTWRSADYSPPEVALSDPLRTGAYRLDLKALNGSLGGRDPAWAVDLIASADKLTLTGVAYDGASIIKSLKFGSSDVSSTANISLGDGEAIVMTGQLVVGKSGRGDLEASGGAIVSGDAWLGFDSGSLGAVVLENSALWSADAVQLGRYGDAGLLVDSGSQAEFYGDVFLAYYSTSSSTVTITGLGSLMTAHADLEVGDGGYGGLHITDRGRLDSRGVGMQGRDVVGDDPTAWGEVTVVGPGALWQTDKLIVGNYGQGTVDVTDGGKIATTGNAYIGYAADGDDSSVTLSVAAPDGTPSTWQVSGDLYIAGSESGPSLADQTQLTINPGGLVDVAGTTNNWDSGLLELHGGTLRTGALGTSDGQIDWTSGTLELTNSGLVLDGRSRRVGTIDAGKSLLLSSPHPDDELVIGDTATANLSVTAGGSIISKSAVMVAKQPGSIGELHVSGAEASVSIQAPFYVGGGKTAYGGTAVLTVDNGGLLETGGETLVYSDSTVAISGYGTLWRAGPIALGAPAPPTTAPLTLTDQARIESGDVQIGPALGVGTAIVDGYVDGIGLPATWDINGSLNIGLFDYARGDFTVQRAGRVNVSETINIAWYGTLQLLGGQITTGSFIVDPGGTFTHTDGTLIVDRGQFTMEGGELWIDSTTGTPTIRLQNGAAGSVEAPRDATQPGGWITIGGDGDGRLEVVSGATLTSGGGRIATWTATYPGVGTGHVLVQGEGSRWEITADTGLGGVWTPSLEVGANGAGTLEIRDRGQVVAAVAAGIGAPFSSASAGLGGPGAVIVDGSGSLLKVTEKVPGYELGYLQVGALDPSTGASGSLTVTNSGRVDVEGTFTVLDAGAVRLASGGKINAGSFIVEPGGAFTHEDGVLTVDGGTLDYGRYPDENTVIDGFDATDLSVVKLIHGASLTIPTANFNVGESNGARLEVLEDADVQTLDVERPIVIGNLAGSEGEVIVDGLGSTIGTQCAVFVGRYGSGSLRVRHGGSVSNLASLIDVIGVESGSSGVVEVMGKALDGSPSTYNTGQEFFVGKGGYGTLVVSAGGRANSPGFAAIAFFPGSDGGGATVTDADSHWAINGTLYVGGSENVAGGAGALTVANDGQVTAGNVKVWQPGAVELNAGLISAGSIELVGGTLRGQGTASLTGSLYNAGVVAPGLSTGLLNVSGDYVQQTAGTLAVELGGRGASQYDRLRIANGQATLAGTLDLSYYNAFSASAGDAFTILDADSLFGKFDAVAYPDAQRWFINYSPIAGTVTVGVSPFSADFDLDGDVDGADRTVWQGAFGVGDAADSDGDGDSDGADFLAWQRQLGGSVPSAVAHAFIPEPATAWLLASGGVLFVRRQRRLAARRRDLLMFAPRTGGDE